MARHVFRSLNHRPFRTFFLGQWVSLTGTWMQSLAQSWLVYRLTESGFMLGLVSAALLLPTLVLSLYGGVLADRYSRHRLLIVAQGLAMAQALTLALLVWLGIVAAWHVVVLALFLGVVQALELPARQSFLAALVPRADLANAIALNAGLFHASRLVGPAIAGFLVVAIGDAWVFLFNALSYLAVLFALWRLRLPHPPEERAPTAKGVRAGIHYVQAHPLVATALVLVGVVAMLGSAGSVLLPMVAAQVYGTGANDLGLLMGAIGAGALVGALRLAARAEAPGRERRIGRSALSVGIGILAFAMSPSVAVSLPILAWIGYAITNVNAATNAYIQNSVPDGLRGRVMSLYAMALHGAVPLGSIFVGLLADGFGAPVALGLAGSVLAVAAYYVSRPLRAAG